MSKSMEKRKPASPPATGEYSGLVGGIGQLLEAARRASARTVNAFMTATYWEIGRRIVEFEQGGEGRAAYGTELLRQLSDDLTSRLGRGFGVVDLSYMKRFYASFPPARILQTLSEKSSPAIFQQALPTKLLVREYLTVLPDEKILCAELERTRKHLESRK